MVQVGNLEIEKGEGGTERVKCLLCGGGERKSSTAEVQENTKVEREATE
jgi:hypothetical protein